MYKVKVILECGSDNRYSAYMDCYEFDFGLAGFGATPKEAVFDFYEAYEQEKRICAKEGKKYRIWILIFMFPNRLKTQ